MSTNEYVEAFGRLLKKPNKGPEVEYLMRTIPDSGTFMRIRKLFLQTYNMPFLPAFLKNEPPEIHRRLLIAFKKACGDYE